MGWPGSNDLHDPWPQIFNWLQGLKKKDCHFQGFSLGFTSLAPCGAKG
jgi:hypothetical protein